MIVDTKTAQHKSEYKGQTYYFCVRCYKVAFDKEPERYLQPAQNEHQHHR